MRGIPGRDLTDALVEQLGRAFALWSASQQVLVGRDTRASGPALERLLARGLSFGGSDVVLGGVLPTAAVALLAQGSGAVVSASHNSAEYNGVKLFKLGGAKLTDADEEAVEALLSSAAAAQEGVVVEDSTLAHRYAELVCERFGSDLSGLRIACDCANGALSAVAPGVLERLGARVTPLAAEPSGENINDGCGATDPALLAAELTRGEYDLGVAFDGDGDRLVALDEHGVALDGDALLAILALDLGVDLVAVTSMTNLGFHRFAHERGIRVLTTEVGDRYLLEALTASGGVLGGEQSGHILYLEGHTTGDGLVAALLLARAMRSAKEPLSELARVLRLLPQVRRDLPVATAALPPAVLAGVESENRRLAGRGRALVRRSGTEPVVRILAEAEEREEAAALCVRIEALIRRELGVSVGL